MKDRLSYLVSTAVFALIFTITFFLLLSGCTSKKEKSRQTETGVKIVDLESAIGTKRTLMLSEIAEDIQYVKLEAKSGSYLSRISKVCLTSEYIFIKGIGNILQFTREGRFVRMVGAVGRGPGEYLLARDFAVNDSSKRVYIYGHYQSKLLVYDFNGRYLRSFNVHSHVTEMISFSPNRLMLAISPLPDAKTKMFSIIDTTGIVVKDFPFVVNAVIPEFNTFQETCLYTTAANRMNFWPFLSDTIYTISGSLKAKPAFLLSYGSKKPTYEEAYVQSSVRRSTDKFSITPIAETGSYLFINYRYKNEVFGGVFDKKKGEFFNVVKENGRSGFTNDLDGGYGFSPKFSRDGCLVAWYSADWFLEKHTEEFLRSSKALYPEKKVALRKLLEEMQEDDNPVIVVVRLKKSGA